MVNPTHSNIPDIPEQRDKSWHRLVSDPTELKRKVPPFGGKDPEEAFRKANLAIRNMVGDYIAELGSDIEKLIQLAKVYQSRPCRETLTPIYQIVHNMRGQGATFNYPLVTQIGKSLCQYCIELPDESQANTILILDHIHALKLVHSKHLEGQGDDLSQAVVESLQEAVEIEVNRSRQSESPDSTKHSVQRH